ncbi:hypothetical protein DL767_005803 [Monosporascus sp. MG133]|nr:hypothetical protein DL767_005803 [Monosporascus sp. MG133]
MATPSPPSTLPSTALEKLPPAILEEICEFLASCDRKRRSLFAFSLVSRRCYEASTRRRFERIHLVARDSEELRQKLGRWKDLLARHGYIPYVRRLKISGYMPHIQSDHHGQGARPETEVLQGETMDHLSYGGEANGDDDDADFCMPSEWLVRSYVVLERRQTREVKQRRNDAWLPLARFIAELSALTDVAWASPDPIPGCILRTLHQIHADVRLHVHYFNLPSLRQPPGPLEDIDEDDYALVTSPCLYSLAVSCCGYDSGGNFEYHEEAVWSMVASTAPKLRHVLVWSEVPGDTLEARALYGARRRPWQGFFPSRVDTPADPPVSKGRLQALRLAGRPLDTRRLEVWNSHTDFSKLCSLQIHDISLDALEVLVRVARSDNVKSLHTLALSIAPFGESLLQTSEPSVDVLLQTLRPLQNLELTGFIGESTFMAILHHHGATLAKLKLIPDFQRLRSTGPPMRFVISYSHIQDLQKQCPGLRELELLLPRSKGDQQEVDIYRTLGALPRLKRLSLLLDCSKHDITGVIKMGCLHIGAHNAQAVRDCLINAAVDSSLASSIFNLIFHNQKLSHGIPDPFFRQLTLQVVRAGVFGDDGSDVEFDRVLHWLGRSWHCERDPRDSHSECLLVREIGKGEREGLRQWLDDDISYVGEGFKDIWTSLWPEKTGDWREDWASLPLQT